ncbi:MAG TPA: SPOR domain-containing protein [Desulfurella acetivorans]|uniref:SPOR domain-containing protein n=1 Tax=Desulfurella acetivorans TaxID=33002 RepID=A0A7C6EB42_DESAE|nr:SPOR domain-containing protein [Desulfurella acetivorans]
MEQDKFNFGQQNQNPPKKTSFGIWTLIVSIVIAFGFGYGVGFVSSAYFRNININKELAHNIQIIQANSTSVENEQTPKAVVPTNKAKKAKIAIQTNSTNATESEIKAITNSLTNQTNSTKTFDIKITQKPKESQSSIQTEVKAQENETNTIITKETKGNYVVQVASFPDRSKAFNLVISLMQKGFNATSEQTMINGVAYTRVIIEAHNLSEANKIATKLKADGITNLPIIYERR